MTTFPLVWPNYYHYTKSFLIHITHMRTRAVLALFFLPAPALRRPHLPKMITSAWFSRHFDVQAGLLNR